MDFFDKLEKKFKAGDAVAFKHDEAGTWVIFKQEAMVYAIVDVAEGDVYVSPFPLNMILHFTFNEDGSAASVPANILEKAKAILKENDCEVEKECAVIAQQLREAFK